MKNLPRRVLTVLCFLFSWLPVKAQQFSLPEAEQELCATYRRMLSRTDTLAHEQFFYEKLTALLHRKESTAYPFDSLKKYIHICKATDLTLFSWNEHTGGTQYMMETVAQLKTATDPVVQRVHNTVTDESNTQLELEVIYDVLYPVELSGQTHYLATGWGTYGMGMHFKSVELFKISGNQLIRFKAGFHERGMVTDYLLLEERRALRLKIDYDEKTGSLTFLTAPAEKERAPFEIKKQWILKDGVFREVI